MTTLNCNCKTKGGRVVVHELPVIDAVRDKMYQLFLNLISNSLKYARDGVSPLISIRCEDFDADQVQIILQDNGIGFNNEVAVQLFRPFKRLHKKDYEGIGIGLSLCQRIVEMHHGIVKAEGVEGLGASFIITLPRRQHKKSL